MFFKKALNFVSLFGILCREVSFTMSVWRRMICVLLAAAVLSALGFSALAAETADPVPMVDPHELSHLVDEFFSRRELDGTKIAVAYCYTLTDETWYHNADLYFQGASLYKLPLMMALAYRVYDGRLQQSDQIGGIDLSEIQNKSLVESDNDIPSMVITDYFGDFRYYKLVLAEIAGITADKLPPEYFTGNIYNARFMMGVLRELYYHEEKYPNILPNMLQANPGQFFRRTLDGQYAVAQKWGGGDGNWHTAGIIYTGHPFLLTVMTWDTLNAEAVIADLAQLFADYTAALDRSLAPEETPSPSPVPTAAPTPTPEPAAPSPAAVPVTEPPAPAPAESRSLFPTVYLLSGGGAVAVLLGLAALLGRRKKR